MFFVKIADACSRSRLENIHEALIRNLRMFVVSD